MHVSVSNKAKLKFSSNAKHPLLAGSRTPLAKIEVTTWSKMGEKSRWSWICTVIDSQLAEGDKDVYFDAVFIRRDKSILLRSSIVPPKSYVNLNAFLVNMLAHSFFF